MRTSFGRAALLLAAGVILASGLVLAADIPAGKATLTLDLIAGKKGAVKFEHTKHALEYKKTGGAKITCKDCHHTLKADDGGSEKIAPCTECHAKVGEAAKTIDGKAAPVLGVDKGGGVIDQKSILMHKNCVDGCHKEMKAEGKKITACKTCHQE